MLTAEIDTSNLEQAMAELASITRKGLPVVIRQRNPDRVLVEGDLAEGDTVVIEGVQTLRPGAEVVPANEAAMARDTTSSAARL